LLIGSICVDVKLDFGKCSFSYSENDGFGCDFESLFLACYFLGFDCS
jgi:hypothetical protein